MLLAAGLALPTDLGRRVADTQLVDQLLTSGRTGRGLDVVAERWAGVELDKAQQRSDWSGDLTADQLRYAAADAAVLLPLHAAMAREIEAAGLDEVAAVEAGCLPAMVWLEHAGCPFDTSQHEARVAAMHAEAVDLTNQLAAIAGRLLNWNSPKQVTEFFAEQGITLGSTAENKLMKVGHPAVPLLLRRRHALKQAGMAAGYAAAAHPKTGRIHGSWWQIGAETGRMSCSSPNLQQVPRKARELVRAGPGRRLVKADYGQIELRVAAERSKDPTLLGALSSGQDLHALTARLVLGREEVTSDDRQAAKACNFGLIFGMGAPKFANYAATTYGVNWTVEEAAEYRNRFFDTYPKIRQWHRSVPDEAVDTRTRLNRRRLGVESFTEKLNSPISGSAADGLKAALGLLYERRGEVPGAEPVLAVHDEIVIECPVESVAAVKSWLHDAMVDGMRRVLWKVPVAVDVSAGNYWGEKV